MTLPLFQAHKQRCELLRRCSEGSKARSGSSRTQIWLPESLVFFGYSLPFRGYPSEQARDVKSFMQARCPHPLSNPSFKERDHYICVVCHHGKLDPACIKPSLWSTSDLAGLQCILIKWAHAVNLSCSCSNTAVPDASSGTSFAKQKTTPSCVTFTFSNYWSMFLENLSGLIESKLAKKLAPLLFIASIILCLQYHRSLQGYQLWWDGREGPLLEFLLQFYCCTIPFLYAFRLSSKYGSCFI